MPRTRLLAVPLVFLGAACAWAQAAIPAAAEGPTIQVSAQGQFEASPDTALVSMQITGDNADLQAAYREAQTQAEQVRDLLKQQGFTPEQAHWSGYSVEPNMNYQTHKLTSYTVTTSVRLEFTDFTKIAPLLNAAGAAGLSAVRNVSFELKHPEAAKAAAIADGYRQAHLAAEALAQAAGRQLQALARASVDTSLPGPVFVPRMLAMASAAPAPTEQFSPSQITVSATVNLVYLLRP
ncbi:MAG: SIMPL domain-containing protein [Terriglobales bacterium]